MANPNKPDQPKGMQSAGNPSHRGSESENYSLRCKDVGFNDCPWEAKGATPDEVLHKAEQHGREQHHLTNMDEATRNKVRSNIHRAA